MKSNQELARSNRENFELQWKALEAIAVSQDLPLVTLKKFNGDPSRFPAFMNGFESLVKQKVKDPARLFHTLLEYCEGDALRVIGDFSVLPSDEAYKASLRVLEQHFGQSHQVARALVSSLLNYEHLEKNRNVPLGKKLLEFSAKMTSVSATLRKYKREADVNSSETLKVLVAKLPSYAINEWKKDAARIYEKGNEPNLDDLIGLVGRLASRENHTYSEVQSARERREYAPRDDRNNTRARNQSNPQAKITTMATDAKERRDSKELKPGMLKSPNKGQRPSGECLYCKKPHEIDNCFKFKSLEATARMEFGRDEKLCFNCLKRGHLSPNCRFYSKCLVPGCKGKHNSLFHGTGGSSPSGSGVIGSKSVPSSSSGLNHSGHSTGASITGASATGAGATGAGATKKQFAHILLDPSPMSLGILPVRISAKGGKKSVEGYAFLDKGPTGTVFLESLVDQLDVGTTPAILNCETMNATTCEEGVTLDLIIESLDGSGQVDCTGYSQKSLAVGNRSIPMKEQVQGFSHLRDIDFP